MPVEKTSQATYSQPGKASPVVPFPDDAAELGVGCEAVFVLALPRERVVAVRSACGAA